MEVNWESAQGIFTLAWECDELICTPKPRHNCRVSNRKFFIFYLSIFFNEWEHRTGTLRFSSLYPSRKGRAMSRQVIKHATEIPVSKKKAEWPLLAEQPSQVPVTLPRRLVVVTKKKDLCCWDNNPTTLKRHDPTGPDQLLEATKCEHGHRKATNEQQDDGAGILHLAAQFPIDQVYLYTRHPSPSLPIQDPERKGNG